MYKKIFSIFLCVVLVISFSINVFADKFFYDGSWNTHNENIKLYFNDNYITTDVPSLIVKDRTLVPVRAFFEYIGADVLWNDVKREVTIKVDDLKILIGIDSYVAYVNGSATLLDVPAKIVTDSNNNGRTLVPIRFISENLGYDVSWDEKTYSVYVSEKNENSIEYITNIAASRNGISDYISVTTTSKAKPVVTKIANPERLVLDFYDFELKMKDGAISNPGVNFTKIRFANHDHYARIVIDISYEYSYEVSINGNLCTIKLTKTGAVIPTTTPSPSTSPKPTTSPKPSTTPRPSATPGITDIPTAGNGLVVIDPGHGGSDPGAIGYKDGEIYIRESDINLDISLKLYEMLKKKGVNVAMTRSTDVYVGLRERAEFANNLDASLFICVHNNSSTSSAANGSMVYYFTSDGDEDTKAAYGMTSKEVAQLVHKGILKYGKRYDRKIADGSKFVVLYSTAMPAILTECAFVSNDEERELLNTEKFKDDLAKGICEGVIESLKKMGLY